MEHSNLITTYLSFKIFFLFRDRLIQIINEYRPEPDSELPYNHIFLSPENHSKNRAFKVQGVASPFISLWATSPLRWNDKFYGKSVLPIDFQYEFEGETFNHRGFLYDFKKSFNLTAGSYFKSFVDSVNFDLLEIDRLRAFQINVDELLPGYKSVIMLDLEGLTSYESVSEASDNRQFNLSAKYEVSVTLPILSNFDYLDAVTLFLKENHIWQKNSSVVDP